MKGSRTISTTTEIISGLCYMDWHLQPNRLDGNLCDFNIELRRNPQVLVQHINPILLLHILIFHNTWCEQNIDHPFTLLLFKPSKSMSKNVYMCWRTSLYDTCFTLLGLYGARQIRYHFPTFLTWKRI